MSAASRALSIGTYTSSKPCFLALATIGKTPVTGRRFPSSESSPRNNFFSTSKSISSAAMRFGVLADTVEGVQALRADELKKLPTLSGVREEYLTGVSPTGITVLDAGRLLADRSIIVYETAEQA